MSKAQLDANTILHLKYKVFMSRCKKARGEFLVLAYALCGSKISRAIVALASDTSLKVIEYRSGFGPPGRIAGRALPMEVRISFDETFNPFAG